jgi:1-phosphofructokinase
MSELKEIQPWLIKPNEKEALALLGISEMIDSKEAAKKLSEIFPQVILSLGAEGLMYASNDCVIRKAALPTKVYTTVGAGDSLVAGFLYGMVTAQGDLDKALDYGLMFAAETCSGM